MIRQCVRQLVGNPDKGGHFFTIWAPRQCGKTWLMRQAREDRKAISGSVRRRHDVHAGGDSSKIDDPKGTAVGFRDCSGIRWAGSSRDSGDWEEWIFFPRTEGPVRQALILFIDEFDSLPTPVIDRLVTLFRDMYLKRGSYVLHGLALIGVRAVLGVESLAGIALQYPAIPARAQFHPGGSRRTLFRQYRTESGQGVDSRRWFGPCTTPPGASPGWWAGSGNF
jgi:hypothetical protein